MNDENSPDPYERPVAYDTNGQPLYAHPATPTQLTPTKTDDSVIVTSNDTLKNKHSISLEQYPNLNLSDGEYVIGSVRRHFMGLVMPFGTAILLIIVALSVQFNYDLIASSLKLTGAAAAPSTIAGPILLFCLIVAIGAYIAYYVFVSNKVFLTNESVIQEIQISLFSKREQVISLGDVKDTSYDQKGIIQQIFNYGFIKLSTEGDEVNYELAYVANPRRAIAMLNNAVESFKNSRPIRE
jgi:hypothetical protein